MATAKGAGCTAQQRADAKKGLLLSRRLGRAQDAQLASTLALELEVERTMAFDQRIDQAIEALTLEQVNAAFRKYLDASQLVAVYAGDSAKGPTSARAPPSIDPPPAPQPDRTLERECGHPPP